MYLTEDISNFIKKASPSSMMLCLKFKASQGIDNELDSLGDKILVLNAWKDLGRDDALLEQIKGFLGPNYKILVHPILDKLRYASLERIVKGDLGFDLPLGVDPIIKEVLHSKLYEYLQYNGITALAKTIKVVKNEPNDLLLTYNVKSKYAERYLLSIEISAKDGDYGVVSRFLGSGVDYNPSLTPESTKKVNGIIYSLTENSGANLDLTPLNNLLATLQYEEVVLDCFIQNIKGYTKNS